MTYTHCFSSFYTLLVFFSFILSSSCQYHHKYRYYYHWKSIVVITLSMFSFLLCFLNNCPLLQSHYFCYVCHLCRFESIFETEQKAMKKKQKKTENKQNKKKRKKCSWQKQMTQTMRWNTHIVVIDRGWGGGGGDGGGARTMVLFCSTFLTDTTTHTKPMIWGRSLQCQSIGHC